MSGLPVHAIGIDEGADDLCPFVADDFASTLMGLDGGGVSRSNRGSS